MKLLSLAYGLEPRLARQFKEPQATNHVMSWPISHSPPERRALAVTARLDEVG